MSSESSYEPMEESKEEPKEESKEESKILTTEALEILDYDEKLLKELEKNSFAVMSFCVFFASVFLHIPSSSMYDEQRGITSALVTSGDDIITNNSPVKFFNVETIPDIFDWLNSTFIPQVFVTSNYNGTYLPKSQWGQIATFNSVLGAVQFEVVNMQQVECDTPTYLKNLYSNCYDASSTTTDKLFINFDTNATDAITEMTRRKESGTWINASTQHMEITVITFNGELHKFSVTELQFDFNDGGFVKSSTSTASVAPIIDTDCDGYFRYSMVFSCPSFLCGRCY